jgi:outer membrane protein insertion porin family
MVIDFGHKSNASRTIFSPSTTNKFNSSRTFFSCNERIHFILFLDSISTAAFYYFCCLLSYMLRYFKLTYILLISIVSLISCRQTKHVPEGKYLIRKNNLEVNGDPYVSNEEYSEIIRQQPNRNFFLFKTRLWAYNSMDSTHIARKRIKKNHKIEIKNEKRIRHQNKINKRRIERARKDGDLFYSRKKATLTDTIEPKRFFGEWFKYKYGEPPVIFNEGLYKRSTEQLGAFLKKKGFYYGNVTSVVDSSTHRKKIDVSYVIETGPLYHIDSVYTISTNPTLVDGYNKYLSLPDSKVLLHEPFDSDVLDSYRNTLARFLRDEAIYGFSPSHINYLVDTNFIDMSVNLGIQFSEKAMISENKRDSVIYKKHQITYIKDVYFHISDTTGFDGDFIATAKSLGLAMNQQFLPTLDTLNFPGIVIKKSDSLSTRRMVTFYYNGELFLNPGIIETQNYLEKNNYYKDKYVERTYTRLQQLGVFQTIKPVIVEIPNTNYLEIHYYLIPAKKHSIGVEPRFTTSNGYLGISGSIDYANKNLFKGAEKLTVSLGMGLESQPPIFFTSTDGIEIQQAARSFNTFEIGPSIKLEQLGLFPISKTKYYKRQRARTIISTAYNFQKRTDFSREVFQLNYMWKFYVNKTQIYQIGLPGESVVKYVKMNQSLEFESRINDLNDVFLRNTYSDQFIWQDWKVTYEYNNKDKDSRVTKSLLYFNSSFDPAGNILSLFKDRQDTTEFGQREIFGVGYAQFMRLDNELIFSHPFGKIQSIHARASFGGGLPYGNSTTSMPYDYSFFGGGANDNRGWRARSLGPGGYKYYLDTSLTATQVGDIRLAGFLEYRYSLGKVIKTAVFLDAGNIWTVNEDIRRPGAKFSSSWMNQVAISGGIGLRLDFDFLIFRLDMGIPLRNPALPAGSNWIFQSSEAYQKEVEALNYSTDALDKLPKRLFRQQFHIGIGYPF